MHQGFNGAESIEWYDDDSGPLSDYLITELFWTIASGCTMYSADWATDTTQLRGERPGWNYFRGVEFAGISALWRAGQALVIVSDTKVIVCAKTLNDMRTIESSFGVSLELNDY